MTDLDEVHILKELGWLRERMQEHPDIDEVVTRVVTKQDVDLGHYAYNHSADFLTMVEGIRDLLEQDSM